MLLVSCKKDSVLYICFLLIGTINIPKCSTSEEFQIDQLGKLLETTRDLVLLRSTQILSVDNQNMVVSTKIQQPSMSNIYGHQERATYKFQNNVLTSKGVGITPATEIFPISKSMLNIFNCREKAILQILSNLHFSESIEAIISNKSILLSKSTHKYHEKAVCKLPFNLQELKNEGLSTAQKFLQIARTRPNIFKELQEKVIYDLPCNMQSSKSDGVIHITRIIQNLNSITNILHKNQTKTIYELPSILQQVIPAGTMLPKSLPYIQKYQEQAFYELPNNVQLPKIMDISTSSQIEEATSAMKIISISKSMPSIRKYQEKAFNKPVSNIRLLKSNEATNLTSFISDITHYENQDKKLNCENSLKSNEYLSDNVNYQENKVTASISSTVICAKDEQQIIAGKYGSYSFKLLLFHLRDLCRHGTLKHYFVKNCYWD